jgi:DNA repair exonuclease SbcCD ATPase subunit
MWFGLLTLITALAIAGVAAWFSIAGLMIFFGGMPLSIAIMAGVLEVGKLLTASWLYRYWSETSFALKTYLSSAVLVLMLITSAGIYGYLAKASSDVSSDGAVALAEVNRIDGQIAREENKIDIIEDRILSIGGSVDVSESIKQQETIRDGAWDRVQGDIDFANSQIVSLRAELTTLNEAVNELRNKGVEVVTLDEGGAFRQAETEKIDYVAQANQLFEQQKPQRDQIQADIKLQQDNIDNYRAQAQKTIDDANAEINRLRNNSQSQQDDNLVKIDAFNGDIDAIYNTIATLKDEKFEAESIVRDLEREIGPIKYVAELLYGESSQDVMDQAIRIFILLFVFVFDPLAVMLLIAANQTLLRYGINLESTGPKDPDPEDWDMLPDPEELEIFKKMQEENASAAEDAAKAMAESASQKKRIANLESILKEKEKDLKEKAKQLAKKPKIVEVEKEVPVEVEKIVEVEIPKEIEIIKEVERIVEKEVPGPERIVEVPGPETIVVKTDNSKIEELEKHNQNLQGQINTLTQEVEKKVEPEVIQKAAEGDLRDAARLMAQSELNKEDLTEEEIFNLLQKSSEEEVKRKIGFWAMPLPTDTDKPDTNKRYIGKK